VTSLVPTMLSKTYRVTLARTSLFWLLLPTPRTFSGSLAERTLRPSTGPATRAVCSTTFPLSTLSSLKSSQVGAPDVDLTCHAPSIAPAPEALPVLRARFLANQNLAAYLAGMTAKSLVRTCGAKAAIGNAAPFCLAWPKAPQTSLVLLQLTTIINLHQLDQQFNLLQPFQFGDIGGRINCSLFASFTRRGSDTLDLSFALFWGSGVHLLESRTEDCVSTITQYLTVTLPPMDAALIWSRPDGSVLRQLHLKSSDCDGTGNLELGPQANIP